MIKLLAIDMDGTCLDSRSRMTDRTIRALRRAADGVMPSNDRDGVAEAIERYIL